MKHLARGGFVGNILAGILFASVLAIPAVTAQNTEPDYPGRHEAFQLYEAGRLVDAMPLLEKLAAEHPSDLAVKERWAFSIAGYAKTLADPDMRKRARVRARKICLEMQQAGDTSALLKTILDSIPEDGSEANFSDRQEVNAVMKAAEADFATGAYDKAREGYIRALLLDPNEYEAALFTGDIYFRQRVFGSAGEWFARAIQINPNRETAYRYWGDALTMAGKMDEARTKFIDAIVAEPYNRLSWQGISQWAQRNGVALNYIRLKDQAEVTSTSSSTNVTLDSATLAKNDLNGLAWFTYATARESWQVDKFKKEFPNESSYRRTLKEEAESLHVMVEVLTEQKDFEKRSTELESDLRQVIGIDRRGFMESFVLLNRANADIARDYESYRTTHRDRIRQYLDEFVVPKLPASPGKQP